MGGHGAIARPEARGHEPLKRGVRHPGNCEDSGKDHLQLPRSKSSADGEPRKPGLDGLLSAYHAMLPSGDLGNHTIRRVAHCRKCNGRLGVSFFSRHVADTATQHEKNGALPYSHSIVAGGFDEMSYTTRLTPGTSATMRPAMASRTSAGMRAQSAVMASSDSTARTATTLP